MMSLMPTRTDGLKLKVFVGPDCTVIGPDFTIEGRVNSWLEKNPGRIIEDRSMTEVAEGVTVYIWHREAPQPKKNRTSAARPATVSGRPGERQHEKEG